MMKRKLSVILVFALILPTILSVTALAANYPSLSSSAYCEFTAAKQINVWKNTSCTTRGTSNPSKNYNAYISKNDVCYIYKITSSYAQVNYPTSSGRKTGYIKTSDLLGSGINPSSSFTASSKVTTLKYKNGATSGYYESGDKVYKISGTNYNVMYTAKSGKRAYKLAYANTTPEPITSSWQFPMNNVYCTWKTKTDMSWSGYNYSSSRPSRTDHLGIDIYGTNGTVYAAASGKVVACSSSNSGANGRYVIIQHTLNGKTVYSFYAHLASLNVSKGSNISKGNKIGVAGGSGYGKNNNYGTHLHFAIVDTLWSGGGYYGYSTSFSGNEKYYKGVTYYNPVYIINKNKLP